MSRHNAYFRVYGALESLILGTGNDINKIDSTRLWIPPLTATDFSTEEEKIKFEEVMSFYKTYKGSYNDVKDTRPYTSEAHWTVRKKFKKNLLELFNLITEPNKI